MPTTANSTFISPNEFHVNELIQANSEIYLILNEKMLPDHFAFQVAALEYDFSKGSFRKEIKRIVLPGSEHYRVFGAETRVKLFHLAAEPYPTMAWAPQLFIQDVPNVDWHNDPHHNDLP